MPPRVILVQPTCKDREGHPYAAIKSLEAAIAPVEPLICIHRRASRSLDLPDDRAIRHFGGRITCSATAGSDGLPGAISGSDELDTLFDRLAIGREDHVVFPSGCAETALALLRVLRRQPAESWPHCHLRFIGVERRRDLEPMAHAALSDLRRRSARVHLYAEFEATVGHVLRHYDEDPFELVRLPTLWPDEGAPAVRSQSDATFTIGVLGQLRRDKGKYRLGPILAEFFGLMRRAEFPLPIEVRIQSDARLFRTLHLRGLLASRLGREMKRVHVIPTGTSNKEFVDQMRRCDVILLPYMREDYERRGSGIAIDAVAHGVPFVCTAGTAMCELLGSGNGLSADTNQEFAACLRLLAEHRDRFRAAAHEAAVRAREWRSNSLLAALRGTIAAVPQRAPTAPEQAR
jgi:glycosyltransferase involved in cell wall biosynthesis